MSAGFTPAISPTMYDSASGPLTPPPLRSADLSPLGRGEKPMLRLFPSSPQRGEGGGSRMRGRLALPYNV
ncbi:hypothetical protein RvVAR0630_11840 [Agrobacterium vitis]|nr:hypothetical protein RvVAR0630_11840 [Agrobacterium vitis]